MSAAAQVHVAVVGRRRVGSVVQRLADQPAITGDQWYDRLRSHDQSQRLEPRRSRVSRQTTTCLLLVSKINNVPFADKPKTVEILFVSHLGQNQRLLLYSAAFVNRIVFVAYTLNYC